MYAEFHKMLSNFKGSFTKEGVAAYFGVTPVNFKESGSKIIYTAERVGSTADALLKGTIFCAESNRIVRGYPKIYYGAIYQDEVELAREAEQELLQCNELLVEKKEDGTNIRVWLAICPQKKILH